MSTIPDCQSWASLKASNLGQRLGIDALIYNPGAMRMFDRFAQRDAPGFTRRLCDVFGLVRYLDVGAGTGRYAENLRKLGAAADACEHSRSGRLQARRRGMKMTPFDLSANPPGPDPKAYDVAFSLEVAEHVPPTLGDRLVEYLSACPTVVFTAAHPGQGGTGHTNEQPKAYWEQRFACHGHRRERQLEEQFLASSASVEGVWLLENLMIYRR